MVDAGATQGGDEMGKEVFFFNTKTNQAETISQDMESLEKSEKTKYKSFTQGSDKAWNLIS